MSKFVISLVARRGSEAAPFVYGGKRRDGEQFGCKFFASLDVTTLVYVCGYEHSVVRAAGAASMSGMGTPSARTSPTIPTSRRKTQQIGWWKWAGRGGG